MASKPASISLRDVGVPSFCKSQKVFISKGNSSGHVDQISSEAKPQGRGLTIPHPERQMSKDLTPVKRLQPFSHYSNQNNSCNVMLNFFIPDIESRKNFIKDVDVLAKTKICTTL